MTWTPEKQRAYMKDYYANHKAKWNGRRGVETEQQRAARLERAREYNRVHHAETRARKQKNREYTSDVQYRGRNLKKYGLTPEIYHATAAAQNGECAICQCKAKLAVDHCHASNRVRALLCTQCNTALGLFKEDVSNLRSAIGYLEAWQDVLSGKWQPPEKAAA